MQERSDAVELAAAYHHETYNTVWEAQLRVHDIRDKHENIRLPLRRFDQHEQTTKSAPMTSTWKQQAQRQE